MKSHTNSYHIRRLEDRGFILYSRITCCAMCDFCSSRTEYHTPIMSIDDEDIPVQVTYCSRNDVEKIEDTGVIPEWCPVMGMLSKWDGEAGDDLVDKTFKDLFPNS